MAQPPLLRVPPRRAGRVAAVTTDSGDLLLIVLGLLACIALALWAVVERVTGTHR